jgi:hypothetical protein
MTTNTKTKTPAVRHDIALFQYRPSLASTPLDKISNHRHIQNMTFARHLDDLMRIKIFCKIENKGEILLIKVGLLFYSRRITEV